MSTSNITFVTISDEVMSKTMPDLFVSKKLVGALLEKKHLN